MKNWHAVSSVVVAFNFLFAHSLYAQPCPACPAPGTSICELAWDGGRPTPKVVTGCHAGVVANWNDGWKTDSCNASAPQGTALLNVRSQVTSSNNGSFTVSRFTTGSMKYTEEVDEAYKAMYEAAVQSGDTKYAAEIKDEWDRHRRIAQQWEGTSDAARVTVTAKGSGNFWDQWRGWQDVDVTLEVICIAPANIRDQLEKKLGFNQFAAKSDQYVALRNDTGTDIFGLAQPLEKGKTSCSDAAGPSSGFKIEKSLQSNFRVNDGTPAMNNQGMCIVFGRKSQPGYADFSKACLFQTARLTTIGSIDPKCIAN